MNCIVHGVTKLVVKNPPANAGRPRRPKFDSYIRKIPWRRKWEPTPVFLPGESLGQRQATVHALENSWTRLK